jgi:hypothetical protein
MPMRTNVDAVKIKYSNTRSVYVMPFKSAMEQLRIDPLRIPETVSLSRENLQWLLKILLRGLEVDERWYRTTYPDVDDAIRQGTYKSAKHHFVENGYFEGRRPGKALVDDEWYQQAYRDIADGIEFGEIASCQEHFDQYGEAEARLPREY